MPNIKSAKKELRKGKKRQITNLKAKNNLDFLIKKSRKAIVADDAQTKELMQKTFKALDKAAQKGIIKNNTRDRKKSRLQKKLNSKTLKK
jgi:small subunit ribosomal protein S20